MGNRLHAFHLTPEKWPKPEPFRLGRPLAPRLPMGAGGVNHPNDVAELSDGLLSLGGLGLSGWLQRTHLPNSKLNAAIVGFQRLNRLKPDGLVNPDGPTVKVVNGYLPIPQVDSIADRAPMVEEVALNPRSQPESPAGRPITAPAMGDQALAAERALQARFEADLEAARRADDPNYDIFDGHRRYQRNHIDDMLDEQEAEVRAAGAGGARRARCQLHDGEGGLSSERAGGVGVDGRSGRRISRRDNRGGEREARR